VAKPFFSRECISKFEKAESENIWEMINSVFDVLPLAAVIDDQVDLSLHFFFTLLGRSFRSYVSMVAFPVSLRVQEILFPQ
jgi:diadenosine tetraphosphatase ApaH/serine/threonine PP2A family protein phosphatase